MSCPRDTTCEHCLRGEIERLKLNCELLHDAAEAWLAERDKLIEENQRLHARLAPDFSAMVIRLMEARITLDREREKRRRAEKHIAKREKEIRFMLRESARDHGTIDRLTRELREPCQRCEMRREQESRR